MRNSRRHSRHYRTFRIGRRITDLREHALSITQAAPGIGTHPIPVDGNSTVTIPGVYTHATGATGSETIDVEIRDDDSPLGSNLLETIEVQITRPANCFSGALIGPATPDTGTLTNPDPGGEVRGPEGTSGETEAEIFYRVKDADGDLDSSNSSVTASE